LIGPLGKSVDDIALWLKTVTDENYYKNSCDPYIKIFPFNES
jgi:hypothetical protein